MMVPVLRRPLTSARLLTALAVLALCVAGVAAFGGASSTSRAGSSLSYLAPMGGKGSHRSASGPALLQYWGGAVMRTNTTYAIFWLPSGTTLSYGGNNSGYEAAIAQFLGDVAHDSGTAANVFGLDTQYYDTLSGGQTPIAYNSTFGGYAVATDPLPSKQCSDGTDLYCVTDAQLQTELKSVIAAKGWPQDTSHAYFVFTPAGLGSCSGTMCSYGSYCAYHGAFTGTAGRILYGNEPWLYGHSGCDTGQYPNGGQADPTINVLSHELSEAITDPVPNFGWLDSTGSEIGDKCAWTFGTLSGTKGSQYNETINTHHYVLQEEFDNKSATCQQRPAPTVASPAITSFSPVKGKVGTSVTLAGSGFTGASSVKFNGMSASFAVSSDGKITVTVPAGATTGAISVTTPGGTGTSSSSFTVTG